MKEEWKVYIKGVPNRGNEVVKSLTDLGAKNPYLYDGNNLKALYYIGHDGNIHEEIEELTDSEYIHIIIDNYKEIKLSEKWKDGDILINNDGTDYKVFWEYDSDTVILFYAHNVSMHVNGTLTQYSGSIWHGEKIVCFIEDYRLATNSEAKRFHELLNKCGKEWDAEKKQLVDWRWKPEKYKKYWAIYTNCEVMAFEWDDDSFDKESFDFGNCFRTREEAEAMAVKVKKLLKEKS